MNAIERMQISSIENIKVIPSKIDAINEEVDEFTLKMCAKGQSVEYYVRKRNVKQEKAEDDIFLGKKAEYLAEIGLRKIYGFPNTSPDLTVRINNEKGWEADLLYKQINNKFPNVHVKSCRYDTYRKCGKDYSWTFQYSNNDGGGGKDEIFTKESDDLVAFVYLEWSKACCGEIKAILPWRTVEKYLRDPKSPYMIGIKKCIYYQDLLDNKEKIENLSF